MKLSLLPAAFAFVAVLGIARAAEPPTEEAQWGQALKTFVSVLDGSTDKEALDKLLSDHSWVAPFARNRTESVAVLPALLEGMRVVSARGCLQPSVASATDLVADIQSDPAIAESIRKRLVPADGEDLRHADSTMARWFSTALDAQPGDPVALIAMYDAGRPSAPGEPATPPSLMLLLVRGEVPLGGTPRISRVLYGTLDAAVR
jgi:hypothetical protein